MTKPYEKREPTVTIRVWHTPLSALAARLNVNESAVKRIAKIGRNGDLTVEIDPPAQVWGRVRKAIENPPGPRHDREP